MLLQFIYALSGKNLIIFAIILAALAIPYLLLIYKADVRVGSFGNIASCLAGIVSPLSAVFAVSTEVFRLVFAVRLMIEMALIILAVAAMMTAGKKRPLGIVIILGNYLFCSIVGTMIPLCVQNPDYWIKTVLMVGAFGLIFLIGDSDVIEEPKKSSGIFTPASGDYDYNLFGNPYDNDGFSIYDKGTGNSFHYSGGVWYDQNGNEVPSGYAHARGLDDFYNKNLAGRNLTGPIHYDNK